VGVMCCTYLHKGNVFVTRGNDLRLEKSQGPKDLDAIHPKTEVWKRKSPRMVQRQGPGGSGVKE